MRRAGTRTYPRQEGKGQDRSCSSVRFVYLVSGHCSPCFCSMSRLTHSSRKPGTKNTVASTAPTQTQRGGSGWFPDATSYFSLTPGLFSSNLVDRPSPFGCICIPTLPTARPRLSPRLHLHFHPILSPVPSVHCCRWPVPVGLLTPILMYPPHPYPRLSSPSSGRLECGLRCCRTLVVDWQGEDAERRSFKAEGRAQEDRGAAHMTK